MENNGRLQNKSKSTKKPRNTFQTKFTFLELNTWLLDKNTCFPSTTASVWQQTKCNKNNNIKNILCLVKKVINYVFSLNLPLTISTVLVFCCQMLSKATLLCQLYAASFQFAPLRTLPLLPSKQHKRFQSIRSSALRPRTRISAEKQRIQSTMHM